MKLSTRFSVMRLVVIARDVKQKRGMPTTVRLRGFLSRTPGTKTCTSVEMPRLAPRQSSKEAADFLWDRISSLSLPLTKRCSR